MLSTTELLRKLMSFRPVTGDVACVNAGVAFLRDYLAAAGVFTCVEDQQGRQILYAATQPTRTPRLLLNAHLDVVPAEDDSAFSLQEKDGWLYGRGTVDDLGNCAVVAEALARTNGRVSAGAVFTTDEEVGGSTTRAMVERGYGAETFVLVFDAGDYYTVAIAQKGILDLRLRARGKACHSAEPWDGDNAIDRLIDGYVRVRGLFPKVSAADQWHETMVAAIIQAGKVHNRVPDSAEMLLNLRLTETADPDALIRRVAEVSGCEVTCEMRCPPVAVAADDPLVQGVVRHFETGWGRDLRVRKLNGATDARHFVALGKPIAMLGVPGLGAHAKDERIEKAGFERTADVLTDYLLKTGV